MSYPWPYLARPENCKCQTCQQLRARQDEERAIRAVLSWPFRTVREVAK